MKIPKWGKQYFNGFTEISNYKKNSCKKNTIAMLKIVSYTLLVPPAVVGVGMGGHLLYKGCVKYIEKHRLSQREKTINKYALTGLQGDPKKPGPTQVIQLDKEGLRQKAIVKFDRAIQDRILTVLNDPKFEKNPSDYMQKWINNREGKRMDITEEFALSFFIKELNIA